MIIDSGMVQEQYENYPFPPLEIGALGDLNPPQADAQFAFWYLLRRLPGPALRILDAGCGTGFSTLKLAEANPDAEIVGIDFSEPSLTMAIQRLRAAGLDAKLVAGQIRLLQANLEQLPDLGLFDYIHSSGVLHHLPNPEAGLAGLQRSLKPDGVAYFMVYSARARRSIADIQALLSQLWQDPTDWQEGLKLCRRFFQNLPGHHPLKVFERQTLETAQQLLGPQAANSHAFLVDTYLQRCEHLWTQPEWFKLLSLHNFQPGRWLDEDSWNVGYYLPGMQPLLAQLSLESRLEMADRLRPAHNFALYVCQPEQVLPTWQAPLLEPEARPSRFYCTAFREHADQSVIDNGRGQLVTLNAAARMCLELIDGQHSWQEIWQTVLTEMPAVNIYELHALAKRLLKYEIVAQS